MHAERQPKLFALGLEIGGIGNGIGTWPGTGDWGLKTGGTSDNLVRHCIFSLPFPSHANTDHGHGHRDTLLGA